MTTTERMLETVLTALDTERARRTIGSGIGIMVAALWQARGVLVSLIALVVLGVVLLTGMAVGWRKR